MGKSLREMKKDLKILDRVIYQVLIVDGKLNITSDSMQFLFRDIFTEASNTEQCALGRIDVLENGRKL